MEDPHPNRPEWSIIALQGEHGTEPPPPPTGNRRAMERGDGAPSFLPSVGRSCRRENSCSFIPSAVILHNSFRWMRGGRVEGWGATMVRSHLLNSSRGEKGVPSASGKTPAASSTSRGRVVYSGVLGSPPLSHPLRTGTGKRRHAGGSLLTTELPSHRLLTQSPTMVSCTPPPGGALHPQRPCIGGRPM